MKSWNKIQKEGQKRLTGLQGQKPCKKLGGKRQKIDGGALAKSEREKRLKSFEKVTLKKSNLTLKKKHDSRVSIDLKTASIDWNRQRL